MHLFPYFLGFFALLYLALQIYPYFKLKASRGKASPALGKLLNDAQKAQSRMLLYFMAPSCGMCKGVTPVVDALARKRADIIRIDASQETNLTRELGVFGTPAFVLIQDGLVEKVKLGGLTEKKILLMLTS